VNRLPDQLTAALRSSTHTIILTGAGISAESGIPTFRDAQTGLWARYRPEDLATPEAFERDPDLVWQWYQWRRDLISRARPNPAHLAIAGLERLISKLTLITQNVDGLHQQAGSSAVIEFHGNIHRNRCSVEHQVLDVEVQGTTRPPRCPNCGALIRPDVVWFGEPIPSHALLLANAAAANCDLFLSIGTSSVVQPAAGLAALGRSCGAMIAEINSQETLLSSAADVSLRGRAGSLLPALVAALG
jgi:NAD-dependent deacetylase